MSGNEKKEFGDYQTPPEFCDKVCKYIAEKHIAEGLDVMLEPTCGIGNFLEAAEKLLQFKRICGVEINPAYVNQARRKSPTASIFQGNIFEVSTNEFCGTKNVLVLGNPPWVNNSSQTNNLPIKQNFKGLRGIEAITGASNFDICEYIILKLLDEYKNSNSAICMLCKTTVARNILMEMARRKIAYRRVKILRFDGNKVFGISAAACVLVIELATDKVCGKVNCDVSDFETDERLGTWIATAKTVESADVKENLEGKCQLTWRQGVKHDCGKVMELKQEGGDFVNKYGEQVKIEKDRVFPLVKSSDFKKPILHQFDKSVIVTQEKPKQDTSYIRDKYPRTWAYLQEHDEDFDRRKSIIYKKAPQFSMFGVGDYTFAPYKVGVSGFYKTPMFSLLYADKPVMTDDTAYFLPFYDYDTAYSMMLLLNSKKVQNFLKSIAFFDSKRPYTVKLLSRVDLMKCIKCIDFSEMKRTERSLGLNKYITEKKYQMLEDFIRSLQNN